MRHQKKGLYKFFFFEEVIKSSVFSVTIYCSYVALAFSFLFQVFPLARCLWLEPGVQDAKRKPLSPKWVVPQQSLWEAVLPWRVLERS